MVLSMDEVLVATPLGDARLTVHRAPRPRAVLVLGHGASGGIGARDLVAVARALPERGVTVVRAEQPWRVAGGRVAPRPPLLDKGWIPTVEGVRAHAGDLALFVGGRSAGARVGCRTAQASGAAGVVALAFPLHPPGRPDRSRSDELLGSGVPTLVVQGERDPFGGPDEFPAGPFELTPIPAADHGFRIPAKAPLTQAEGLELVVEAVSRFVLGRTRAGNAPGNAMVGARGMPLPGGG